MINSNKLIHKQIIEDLGKDKHNKIWTTTEAQRGNGGWVGLHGAETWDPDYRVGECVLHCKGDI